MGNNQTSLFKENKHTTTSLMLKQVTEYYDEKTNKKQRHNKTITVETKHNCHHVDHFINMTHKYKLCPVDTNSTQKQDTVKPC